MALFRCGADLASGANVIVENATLIGTSRTIATPKRAKAAIAQQTTRNGNSSTAYAYLIDGETYHGSNFTSITINDDNVVFNEGNSSGGSQGTNYNLFVIY